jgi:hypothetical protein
MAEPFFLEATDKKNETTSTHRRHSGEGLIDV